MKLVVIGNCQARPLADYIEKLVPTIQVTATPIVHLLKDSDEAILAGNIKYGAISLRT